MGDAPARGTARVALSTIVREWARIGVIGFGGPPAHISLLRSLCVERREWISATEFEDAIASVNLLPGPASTQLAIFCAWRLRGWRGALVGGLCFIAPGLAIILALAALFFSAHPPLWVRGAASGASAAVAAVALRAAGTLVPASWSRVGSAGSARARWIAYGTVGAVAAAVAGPFLVLVLIACGCVECAARSSGSSPSRRHGTAYLAAVPALATGGLLSLVWEAVKVGALSYGGGFVIIPLMQHDVVSTYHWMTNAQFLNAVVLGQVTPGPVVQTVAVVGYAAAGLGGGLLAAAVAFAPSFLFVMAGGRHFDRLRRHPTIRSFLTGAGAAVIGAIAGSAIPLALALSHLWQVGVLALAAIWLLAMRRGVVVGLVGAALLGVVAVLAGAPVAH